MDAHDRDGAFTALDAALALSPSSALTYILGSVILGWGGEAEQAIEWSERGMRLSPFDPWAFAAFDAQAMSHFLLAATKTPVAPHTNLSRPIPPTASPMFSWQRRSSSSGDLKKRGQQLLVSLISIRRFVTAANSRA